MLTQEEVVIQFRNRRRRTLWLGALPFTLGILVALSGLWLPSPFGLTTFTQFLIGFGIAAAGLVPMFLIYRCPECGAPILTMGITAGKAFDFSAVRCARCGISFVGTR